MGNGKEPKAKKPEDPTKAALKAQKQAKEKEKRRQKKREALDKKLQAWLGHARHARTFRRGAGFGVILKSGREVMWEGVHERLKRAFWPHDVEDPWLRDRQDRIRRSTAPVHVRMPVAGTSSCPTNGQKHGSECHKQVEEWTKCVVRCSGNLEKGTELFFRERGKQGYDLCTERVIRLCLREHWIPVDSERVIFDEDMKLNTSIDLVVVDYADLRLIMIELKFGYESELWEAHPTDSRLPPPFGKLQKCPHVKSQLQLATMFGIVKRKYKISFDAAYVVRPMPRAHETCKYGLMNFFKANGGKKKTDKTENSGKQNLENLHHTLCAFARK